MFSPSILYHTERGLQSGLPKLLSGMVERTLVQFASVNGERSEALLKVSGCQWWSHKGRMLCESVGAQASRSHSVISFGAALFFNEPIQSLREICSWFFFLIASSVEKNNPTPKCQLFFIIIPHASFRLDTKQQEL